MREPVSGRHVISLKKDTQRYMPSRADGLLGKRRAIQLKENNAIDKYGPCKATIQYL